MDEQPASGRKPGWKEWSTLSSPDWLLGGPSDEGFMTNRVVSLAFVLFHLHVKNEEVASHAHKQHKRQRGCLLLAESVLDITWGSLWTMRVLSLPVPALDCYSWMPQEGGVAFTLLVQVKKLRLRQRTLSTWSGS